jgi:hypothetical protein
MPFVWGMLAHMNQPQLRGKTMENQAIEPPPRSTLVTAIAWVLIVMTGFSTALSLLETMIINTMPVVSGQDLVVQAFLAISATSFVAAVGLLRRKNWARLITVGILGLGFLWSLGSIVTQQIMFSSIGIATAIGLSVLCAWLIKRLLSGPVRAEFQRAVSIIAATALGGSNFRSSGFRISEFPS